MSTFESHSEKKHLIYESELKLFIRNNPGLLGKARKALDSLREIDDSVMIDGVKVTKIPTSSTNVFKIESPEESFFVKVKSFPDNRVGEMGFEEFVDTKEAQASIDDLPWVETLTPLLGYRDEAHTYYISKWNSALQPNLEVYLKDLNSAVATSKTQEEADVYIEEIIDLQKKIAIIRERLGDNAYRDLHSHNMAYDPGSKKIYLFDLQTW
jgi:hypothetical protein